MGLPLEFMRPAYINLLYLVVVAGQMGNDKQFLESFWSASRLSGFKKHVTQDNELHFKMQIHSFKMSNQIR